MSALRLGRRPDGTRDIRVIDDGVESVRMHPSRLGIRGGIGNPIVGGGFVVGKSIEYDPRRHRKRVPATNGRESDWRMLAAVNDHGSQAAAARAEGVSVAFVGHALGRLAELGDPDAAAILREGRLPPGTTCAKSMRYGKVCARAADHKGDHQTRQCMDNAMRKRRAGTAA